MFTYTGYRNILKYAKEISDISSFTEPRESSIVLRHDVDIIPFNAYSLSRIEESLGVKSTFFFLVTSDFYNIFSRLNSSIVKKLHQDGFEIGLHYDFEKSFNFEFCKKALEEIIEDEIKVVSFHNPTDLNTSNIVNGLINAYGKRFFSDEIYFSDSLMETRDKSPYTMIEKTKQKKIIQFSLHPIYWSEKKLSYFSILQKAIRSNILDMDMELTKVPKYQEGKLHAIDSDK